MTAPTSRLLLLERALVRAQTRLALLDSLSPINFGSEVVRLSASFQEGHPELPQFRFTAETHRRERSDAVSSTLGAVQLALSDTGVQRDLAPGLLELLCERIEELRLEVKMLRECGGPQFRALAIARYRFETHQVEEARRLAMAWSEVQVDPADEKGRVLLAAVFEEKRKQMGPLGARVMIVERDLASLCAVGGTSLYVQRGVRVSQAEAERLWLHEVEGHLLPRLRAAQEPTPFSIGAPGSSIDEEGRAVFLEEKHGLLHARRRRDLALRFLLALALREGGDEAVRERLRLEQGRGAVALSLARAVCRVYRGGGLAREVIYLPGYLRVKAALEREPAVDGLFQRGLVSVAALPFFQSNFSREAQSR